MERVLIVATTSYAGMGPYVSEIANTFSKEDTNVYFFFRDYSDEYFRKNIKRELQRRSVFYKRANTNLNTLIDLIRNTQPYYNEILQICSDKDIRVVHFINGIPHASFVRQLRKKGVRVIGTVHDLHPHEAKKAWYKVLRSRIEAFRQENNLHECHNLITNSLSQLKELREAFPKKNIMYHAFPSLVTPEIANGNDIVPELLHLQKPYILFFGRIEAYKGIHLLYEAYMSSSYLKDNYSLVIAGKGDIYFDAQIDSATIVFLNRYIKDSEVKALYANASCVVYPYLSATQSGVLSLAFYFQCPTLASDVSFFKSIIQGKGVGCLFEANNAIDLQGKLIALLKMGKIEKKEMRKAQRIFYENNYDSVAMKTNLVKIYEEVGRKSDSIMPCP